MILKPLKVSLEERFSRPGYGAYLSEDGVLVLMPQTLDKTKFFRSELLDRFKHLPLGQRIKGLRESMGMTQRDLASRAGLTQAEISVIERGASSPTLRVIKALRDGFGVDLEFFIGDGD